MAVLTAAELRNGILSGILTRVPALASVLDESLVDAATISEREVEVELGTRMAVTTMFPWDGAAEPTPGEDEEAESTYQWPGAVPGDGFVRIRPRVRPLVGVEKMEIKVPGSLITAMDVPLSWLRVDRRSQEITIAPTSGTSILGAFLGGVGGTALLPGRLPHTVHLRYKAGLGAEGLRRWPQIRHLLELRTAIHLLGHWSPIVNPTGITSVSADGLSQSRGSGYIFKDLEDRWKAEADGIRDQILGIWDGPMLMVL